MTTAAEMTTTPTLTPEHAPLEYGRQPPLHRRRGVRWAAVGLLVAIAAIVVAHRAYPPLAIKFQLMQGNRACMGYVAPADRVVYDELAARHAASDDMEHNRPSFGSSQVWYAAAPDPPQWTWLQSRFVPTTVDPNSPLAFMHARRSPGGNERLVAIELVGGSGAAGGPLFCLRAMAFERPSRFQPMILRTLHFMRVTTGEPLKTHRPFGSRDARVFAGQPSPDDPSRFTIEVETEGTRRTLTGQLLDDDSFRFDDGGAGRLTVRPVKW